MTISLIANILTDFCLDTHEAKQYTAFTMQQRIKICAYCNQEIHGYPATSRKDNKTAICAPCALLEAMLDLAAWETAKYSSVKN